MKTKILQKEPTTALERDVNWTGPAVINKLAFGIRYEPQFAVMDQIGKVVDAVLRGPRTPFGPDVFPFSLKAPNGHTLHNNQSNPTSLQITQADLVLQFPLDIQRFDRIQDAAGDFHQYIITPLRELAERRNIVRYGLLIVLGTNRASFKTPPIDRYASFDFPGANSLTMRVTRRLPTEKGILVKGISDYRNVIYTVEQNEDGEVSIAVDYQAYFDPPIDTADRKALPFPEFAEQATRHLRENVQEWLVKLMGEREVAIVK